MPAAQPPRFETLDGLRGVGALCIVAGHSVTMWGNLPAHNLIGTMMIDIFFVLSGYVIAFSYEPKFGNRPSVAAFMRSRLVRLYPLYFLGTAMGFVVSLAIIAGESDDFLPPLGQFILALFMAPDVAAPESIFPLNFPAWTLFCELVVNLAYILVWRRLNAKLLAIFVILGGAALIATVLAFGTMNLGSNFSYSIVAMARAWFGFFIGVAIYRGSVRKRETALPRTWGAVALIAIAVPVFFVPLQDWWAPYVEVALVCFLSPAMVYIAHRIEPPRAIGTTFLWLGGISYAVYMLHWPIYIATLRALRKLDLKEADLAPCGGAALLVAVVVIAAIAERYYDQPVRAWLNRKLRRPAVTPVTIAQKAHIRTTA
jgi:peptidoglycan/LPS O-acetylase OafA/YrhL